MNAEMIMGLVIISIVAVIMVIIGISQFNKKENPVGFYNVIAPPKKEEISDVIQWFEGQNHLVKNGLYLENFT